jgi:hypothetical protein
MMNLTKSKYSIVPDVHLDSIQSHDNWYSSLLDGLFNAAITTSISSLPPTELKRWSNAEMEFLADWKSPVVDGIVAFNAAFGTSRTGRAVENKFYRVRKTKRTRSLGQTGD